MPRRERRHDNEVFLNRNLKRTKQPRVAEIRYEVFLASTCDNTLIASGFIADSPHMKARKKTQNKNLNCYAK